MTSTEVKIGEVARRTGLSVRSLRYYEEIGLLPPTERRAGGHRVYDRSDLERLYRIGLLRQIGTPLIEIARALDGPDTELTAAVDRHLAAVDARLAATGRLRERISAVSRTLHDGGRSRRACGARPAGRPVGDGCRADPTHHLAGLQRHRGRP